MFGSFQLTLYGILGLYGRNAVRLVAMVPRPEKECVRALQTEVLMYVRGQWRTQSLVWTNSVQVKYLRYNQLQCAVNSNIHS